MSTRDRRTWIAFAVAVIVGGLGLFLLARRTIAADSARDRAALQAQRAEDLRTALARMDQRFGTLLAAALARVEDQPLAGPRVFDVSLPLGTVRPTDDDPDAALASRADRTWERGTEARQPLVGQTQGLEREQWVQRATERSSQEYLARGNANFANNVAQVAPDLERTFGPPAARWEPAAEPAWLLLGRRVVSRTRTDHQELRFAWPALAEQLLEETRDLFPSATLAPVDPDDAPTGDRLATLPARLVVPPTKLLVGTDPTLVATLLGAGAMALLAALGIGLALRTSLADADRQRRFTAAVTHELRTPLTTFRLYSDMLARGMVPEERRAEYLHTLESESARLAALVENVLAHARLERRPPRARTSHPLGELVEAVRPALERRCAQSDVRLTIDVHAARDARVAVEREDLELVLTNLVDNACKYGCTEDRPGLVAITAASSSGGVTLTVRDEGPGLPPAAAASAFRPFDRAGRDERDPVRGLGLGLALARDVARALGGELTLARNGPGGASFALWLPRA